VPDEDIRRMCEQILADRTRTEQGN